MLLSKFIARIGLLIFIGFGFLIRFFSPEKMESFLLSIPYRCPLRLITGWKCAFCGMTHSWIAVFRGNLSQAFHENLFGPLLWLVFFLFLILYSLGRKIKIPSQLVLLMSLVVLVAYSVLRNVN